MCGVVNVMVQACTDCLETSQYMVYSNKLGSVVDLLVYQFKVSPCTVFLVCVQLTVFMNNTISKYLIEAANNRRIIWTKD